MDYGSHSPCFCFAFRERTPLHIGSILKQSYGCLGSSGFLFPSSRSQHTFSGLAAQAFDAHRRSPWLDLRLFPSDHRLARNCKAPAIKKESKMKIGAEGFRVPSTQHTAELNWCSGRDSDPGPRLERPLYLVLQRSLTGLYYRSTEQYYQAMRVICVRDICLFRLLQ
jgi:hypothetical protein